MKRICAIIFMALTTITVLQAQTTLITGSVANERNSEGIEFATVRLMRDTTMLSGVNTDEKGNFKLRTSQQGKLTLRVSCIGFKTTNLIVQLSDETPDTLNVGKLLLKSNDIALGSAVVSVTASKVEQKEDTTVFNASAYRVPVGSTLEALVKQLPGVEVSDDGTIKWNGKTVTEFLINGKDFFKGDTKTAMKNLPTDLVSKIKAYDKKSDYTEMTGIDDGEETTVLDIATKRELNESWISNVDLGYGTHDRYTGKIFASRFTDNSRITAFGSANNTGDRGFGSPRGWGGGGGLVSNKTAGLDFSWENGKKKNEGGRLELGGNVWYSHTSTDVLNTSSSETFLTGGSTRSSFSNSWSKSGSSSTNVSANLRLTWNPDSMTTIMFRPRFTHSSSRNESESRTGTFDDDPYAIEGMVDPLDSIFAKTLNPNVEAIAVNRNERLSLGESRSNGVSGNLTVTRRFGSLGRNLSFRASAGYTDSRSTSFSISDITYFKNTNGKAFDYLNQYSSNPSTNWNYSLRLSYAEPFAKNWFAEARYEYAYRYTDSDRSLYNLDEVDAQYGDWGDRYNYPPIGKIPTEAEVLAAVRDDRNSQYATYRYQDHKANIGVRYNTEFIRFNAGLDFNPQRTEMEYLRPNQLDTVVVRDVFKVSPQVRLRFRFSKTSQLDLRYRGSSSQPSMTNLLAVVDDSDPLSVSMGNPGLEPSWTNSFYARYNGYNPDRQQGIGGGINFSQTSNSVSNMMVYDETTGVRYTRPENIDGNWNTQGHFMFNTGLGYDKLFTISTFTNLRYDNSVGYVSVFDRGGSAVNLRRMSSVLRASATDYDAIFAAADVQKSITRTVTLGENLNAAYRGSWFDVGVFGSFNYQHARSKLQKNANMDTWNFSYGANANFNFAWNMSISTDIRMSSRRGYSEASMNTNELLWNAQISQSFLKNNAATISLKFYDILHKQSNVSRTINAQMRRDSWSNAINSYIMLHFLYKLNIFPGGKSGGTSAGGGSGRGGQRGGMPPGGGRPMMF